MGKGSDLAKYLELNVNQSLYSEWGNFYAPIKEYPCVLFDNNGFVILKDETDLVKFNIQVGKRVNIPHKISTLPTYQLINHFVNKPPEEIENNENNIY